ncbi:50S ribosomal protein L3 N(5)-glutamine methyltransferase [Kaarinaea lacus]
MPSANEVIDQLETVGDFVRWGASRFNEAGLTFGHGTDNALDEAFYLVTYALHLPHDIPSYMIEARLIREERNTVYELIQKRVTTRLPAPYLTNEAWFAGLPFYVDERVLIPRSPIAELIEAGFEPWLSADQVDDILDLCTGSACIAIASAMACPHAHVDATDLSSEALQVAQKNIERHRVESQVTLHEGDLFQGLEGRRYDVIVSNPPYVDAEDMAALTEEYHHEPAFALAAGEDGLDVVRRILQEARDYLKPGGMLIVEVGNSAAALVENFPHIPFTWLEFERGGHGVFMLMEEQLRNSVFQD